jgi:hypothetical protein
MGALRKFQLKSYSENARKNVGKTRKNVKKT